MDATRTDLSVEVLDRTAVLYVLENVLYDDPVLRKCITIEVTVCVGRTGLINRNEVAKVNLA